MVTGPGPAVLSRAGLDELVAALIADGYRVIGPTVRDDAIVLAETQPPALSCRPGGASTPRPGATGCAAAADQAVFGHSAGAQSWKQFLHPPQQRAVVGGRQRASPPAPEEPVRLRIPRRARAATWPRSPPCAGSWVAARTRRRVRPAPSGLFVIAVGCTEPGGVCFCASMGTGPEPGPGYDLSLTERIDDGGHRFLVDVGTARRRARSSARLSPPRRPPAADVQRGAGRRRGGRTAGWAGRCPTSTCATLLRGQPRVAALGRGRRPLPDLRQLHDGVPDLLLHHHRGQHRPGTGGAPSARSAGRRASSSTSPTCTAAASGPRARAATGSGSRTS